MANAAKTAEEYGSPNVILDNNLRRYENEREILSSASSSKLRVTLYYNGQMLCC
jgi:hypothetical protein